MADRIPFTQGEDKARGVDRVRDAFSNFSSSHAFQIAPDGISRADLRDGISQIWNLAKLETSQIRRGLTGPLAQTDDEQLTVLVCLVVLEKLGQYRKELPRAGSASRV